MARVNYRLVQSALHNRGIKVNSIVCCRFVNIFSCLESLVL